MPKDDNKITDKNNEKDNNINETGSSGSKSSSVASSSGSPRRSARLQMKREMEREGEEAEERGGRRRNVRVRRENYSEDGSRERNGASSEDTSEDSSRTSSRDNTSDTPSNNPTSNPVFPSIPNLFLPNPDSPVISFTFTFEDGRLVPVDTGSAAMPSEMQELLMRQVRAAGSGAVGSSGIVGVSGMAIPLNLGRSSSTRTTSTNTSNNQNPIELDFLSLARQLVQIIFQSRSGTQSAELETLLNDFMTRILGTSTSTAPVGLSPERIAALPTMSPQTSEEFDCSICRETAVPEKEKCVQLECKHCFHFECIEPWLSRVASCPICRKVIE